VGDRERASDATMRGRCCGGAHTRILNDACVRELRSKREDAWEQARLIEKAVGRAEWSEACEAAHGICGSRRRERSNVRVRVAWAKVQARGNSVFGCATRARVGIGDTTGDRGRPRGASARALSGARARRCMRVASEGSQRKLLRGGASGLVKEEGRPGMTSLGPGHTGQIP
jgi:hypothetical protein